MLKALTFVLTLTPQEVQEQLVLYGPKDVKPQDLKVAAKSIETRCVEYGYQGLSVAAKDGIVVVAKKRGGLEKETVDGIARLAAWPAKQAELRVIYRMTAAEQERHKPETKEDGTFGNAPAGAKWFRMASPLNLKPLEACWPLAEKPIIPMSDLTKYTMKLEHHPIRYRPNKDAERVMRTLDKPNGDEPVSVQLALVIDGFVVEQPHFMISFSTGYDGVKRAREVSCFVHVTRQRLLDRDFPLLPLVLVENPLPFSLSPKPVK